LKIDHLPEVVRHTTIQDVNFLQALLPMAVSPHRLDTLALGLGSECRAEPVLAKPLSLVADLDVAPGKRVLDVGK
jgi:hypothetical protein